MRRFPHSSDPWTIPVPVAPSTFRALRQAHAGCNVEVDLGAIGAFFAPRAERIAHADFQLLPDGQPRGRLGAGRAVYYRGHYLKGVGRTPLAANWRLPGDRRHASGHLLPTAAIREYLVSRYVEARGAGDSIVPSTGILLRRLPSGGRAAVLRSLPRPFQVPLSPLDVRFQAISVKPDDFARPSNFTWALHQLEPLHRQVGELALAMHGYFDPRIEISPAACTPRSMVEALAAALVRGFTNCGRYLAAGVHWGFIDNNFSADGRFLDLEVPVVVGPGVFGVVQYDRAATPTRAGDHWIGLEALGFARRARLFVEDLRARLDFLVRTRALQNGFARLFAQEIVRELDRALPRSHLVRSTRAQGRWAHDLIAGPLELGTTGRRALAQVIAARLRWLADQTDAAVGGVPAPVALDLAAYTPGARPYLRVPAWAPPPPPAALALAQGWNDAVTTVDQTRTIDGCFAALRQATRAIARAG
jgi:hypothetical protein